MRSEIFLRLIYSVDGSTECNEKVQHSREEVNSILYCSSMIGSARNVYSGLDDPLNDKFKGNHKENYKYIKGHIKENSTLSNECKK
jgi:hypothetical protein